MEVWNLENHEIEGTYQGVPFKGVVIMSRVCQGLSPAIEHTILLEQAIRISDKPQTIISIRTDEDTADYQVTNF